MACSHPHGTEQGSTPKTLQDALHTAEIWWIFKLNASMNEDHRQCFKKECPRAL